MNKYKKIITETLSKYGSKDMIYGSLINNRKDSKIDFCIPLKKLSKDLDIDKIKSEYIEKVFIDGNFLNIVLNKKYIFNDLLKINVKYGESAIGNNKKIIVEYSSPNIAKEFHAGHLRSTILGEFIKRIYLNYGYDVHTINYLGDWGKQFGKLLLGYEMFGNKDDLYLNPIKHLQEIYVKINNKFSDEEAKKQDSIANDYDKYDEAAEQILQDLENNDQEYLELWEYIRDVSIKKYKSTYQKMGIIFNEYGSEAYASKFVQPIIDKLYKQDILFNKKGALRVDLRKYKLGEPVIQKTLGTTIYLARDLVEAERRFSEYKFDKMFYVVGDSQEFYFKQLFTILSLMGYPNKYQHIGYGNVSGMSTRKGNVIYLEDMIKIAREKMYKKMLKNPDKFAQIEDKERTAHILGLSAIYVQDMMSQRKNSYTFDWKRIKNFHGHTGPSIQYAYARISSIIDKCGIELDQTKVDIDLLAENDAYQLARQILIYQDVLLEAFTKLEPYILVQYMFELSHKIASAHAILRVKDEEETLAQTRLYLFWCGRLVLGKCLELIGLTPLDRM